MSIQATISSLSSHLRHQLQRPTSPTTASYVTSYSVLRHQLQRPTSPATASYVTKYNVLHPQLLRTMSQIQQLRHHMLNATSRNIVSPVTASHTPSYDTRKRVRRMLSDIATSAPPYRNAQNVICSQLTGLNVACGSLFSEPCRTRIAQLGRDQCSLQNVK